MKRLLSFALTGALVFSLVQLPVATSAATSGLSPLDAGQIAISYQQLTTQFYKKTDPQQIVDGARTTLLLAMSRSGVKSAALPTIHATDSAAYNVHAVDRAVELAAKQSGSKISTHELSYAAIAGMLDSVRDRYTVFLDPRDYAALNQGLDGSDFGGTGIVIQSDDTTKYITVSNIVPDAPADKAGIQQDDTILSIDGLSTKGMTIQKASSHLRGKEGTTVVLSVQREGATLPPITITRAKIHQLSVYEKMLPGKIGYVALSVFGRDTGNELETALGRLLKSGARAFVLDLRDNGGGYLDSAVAVSSEFISSGPIVSVESRASNITTYEADDKAIAPVPLAVLVNGHTASASEITSGAIQDDGAGTIIGTKTFGKGVVQNIYPLPDGSAIKITIARYLTPHNRDINHLGITPDIVFAENNHASYGVPSKDAQLQRALDFLNDRLAHLNGATPTGSN
jgi:carboxyl-terminal processing protease